MLGFTSVDNVGTTGIEKYYDEYLAGKKGELLYETDLVGIEIEGSVATYLPAEDGYHVELTIDYGIQEVVESALERVANAYHPVSAECIVLDVNTFEVLALANYPSYDLNEVPRNDGELLNARDLPLKSSPLRQILKNICVGIIRPFQQTISFPARELVRWTARR